MKEITILAIENYNHSVVMGSQRQLTHQIYSLLSLYNAAFRILQTKAELKPVQK